ncbi:ArsR/SmtB family transcription factor [Streptosporangium sp. CA-135522]|uniref:ArsR/SmtB family transcription factor n=1 Tax=Streptosporangium sp. CA-135522 TaxID=3240072 RepID=UPI003D89F2B1
MEDHLVLREAAQFKALGHPLRHRPVNALRQRRATMAQLATALGSTKGTVGYHIKMLQDAGPVRPGDRRQVRGGTEQYYELVSKSFTLHEDAEADFLIKAAMAEMLTPSREGAEFTRLHHVWLTAGEAEAPAKRIRQVEPGTNPTDGREPYGMPISLYRANIPTLPEERPDR